MFRPVSPLDSAPYLASELVVIRKLTRRMEPRNRVRTDGYF